MAVHYWSVVYLFLLQADTFDYDAGEKPDLELPERDLQWICNFPYSVTALLPVYDSKEHDSLGTGAEPPGDFPDSVVADSPDYVAGEKPDPWSAGARAPWDL